VISKPEAVLKQLINKAATGDANALWNFGFPGRPRGTAHGNRAVEVH